jgi:hypothetical protein
MDNVTRWRDADMVERSEGAAGVAQDGAIRARMHSRTEVQRSSRVRSAGHLYDLF